MEKNTEGSPWYQESSSDGTPLADQAREKTGQVVQQTKQAASRVADQAVEQVKTRLSSQKERATDGLEGLAQALHETGQTLRDREMGVIGDYADSGAELVEQISGYFRDRNLDQIVDDAETLARRHAGLFVGSAFALGFILARFFKSSSSSGPNGQMRGEQADTGYARASGATVPATAEPAAIRTALDPSTT